MIRKAKFSDAVFIQKIRLTSIKHICSSDYSKIQIDAWLSRKITIEQIRDEVKDDVVEVIETNSRIWGYSHYKKYIVNNVPKVVIVALYIAPNAIGRGFGKELLESIIKKTKSWQYEYIELQSTITAKDFYKKNEFYVKNRSKIIINSVNIPFFTMERSVKDYQR